MVPTGPSCVFGHLHPYGPEAVFHISKVGRICPRCEKGNDERAERAEEEHRCRAVRFCGMLEVVRECEDWGTGVFEEERANQEAESNTKVGKKRKGRNSQRGFYWGRGD